MNLSTTIELNNGVRIPILGLGAYQIARGKETVETVRYAIEVGYRHVDTARLYGNEADVAAGWRASGIPREDMFITTKLWETDQGYESSKSALRKSLQLMALDYVDLFLIHWPVARKGRDSWRGLEELMDEGKARAIGVSNYMVSHLDDLFGYARVLPAVNQIEITPFIYRRQRETIDLCRANGIAVEAYSPLTQGRKLNDPRLVTVAGRYARTPAQILIRWCLEKGFIVLPKSNRPERIRENAAVFDFTISAEDMALLDSFNEN